MSLIALTTISFPTTAFPPLAVGFFGLGTGYVIWGPQELLGFPTRTRQVDLSNGLWGIWMPGFMQFVAGMYLFAALVIFHSIRTPCCTRRPWRSLRSACTGSPSAWDVPSGRTDGPMVSCAWRSS